MKHETEASVNMEAGEKRPGIAGKLVLAGTLLTAGWVVSPFKKIHSQQGIF